MRALLRKILAKLRQEPVRARLYGVAVLVVGYALAKGYVSAGDHDFILAVLAIVGGTEAVRSTVSPTDKDR